MSFCDAEPELVFRAAPVGRARPSARMAALDHPIASQSAMSRACAHHLKRLPKLPALGVHLVGTEHVGSEPSSQNRFEP